MTLLERVGYTKQVWMMAMPNVVAPSDEFLIKLCGCYTEPEIEHAVIRTSKKFHGQTLEPIVLHRYCAGVLRNERKRIEQVSVQTATLQEEQQ